MCPQLATILSTAWPMMIFPFAWVGIGVCCGFLAAQVSCVPSNLYRTLIAAVAFGNSTGLPIVLLTAIAQSNVLQTGLGSDMEKRNFLLLLSIYQITYPLIQWSVAGQLLKSVSTPNVDVAIAEPLQRHDQAQEQGLHVAIDHEQEREADACLTRFREFGKAALVPPVIAVIAGTLIGGFPWFRFIFVDTTDFNNDRPLEWFFNAIEQFGMAAVPLNMLVLGSSLASIPSFANVHWPSTLAAVFVKMVVFPALVCGVVSGMHMSGLISKMTPDHNFHYQLMIVACLVSATPTANNLAVMAEVSGGPACKQALASMIFMMYCFAPFLLTAWIIVFVSLNRLPGP